MTVDEMIRKLQRIAVTNPDAHIRIVDADQGLWETEDISVGDEIRSDEITTEYVKFYICPYSENLRPECV